MPRFIVKIKDMYLEWSTIVDAPVVSGMTRKQFNRFYKNKYGTEGMYDLADRMARVEEKGTSSYIDGSVEDLIKGNRAGENEAELTLDEIYRVYCLREKLNGWTPFKD